MESDSPLHQIALALAHELQKQYPHLEIIVTPSDWYDLKKDPHAKLKTFSISALFDRISPWGVNINGDFISVSIHIDNPEMKVFNDIEGLPDVAFGVMVSNETKAFKYALADPRSIEKVLAKIEEYYPISERIESTDNPKEQ